MTEERDALQHALQKNAVVTTSIEACAEGLGAINALVKSKMGDEPVSTAVLHSLAQSEVIEEKVTECVGALHDVKEHIVQGADELKRTKDALSVSHDAVQSAKHAEREAQRAALHDAKTGLPNRMLFDDRLAQAIALAERNAWMLAVLFFDLDQFKKINDLQGHVAGDAVLKEVARRLQTHCREDDTLCRDGGDEFLYLLVNPLSSENVENIARRVLDDLIKPFEFEGHNLAIKVSIGVALFPDHGTTAENLINCADDAMYRAKRMGSQICYVQPSQKSAPDCR